MTEILFISTASRILGLHPQTLRKYERLGLIQPERTVASMRLYSPEQIERLRLIKYMVDELGINLAGVRQLLLVAEIADRLDLLISDEELRRRDGLENLAYEVRHLREVLGLT